ncbi:MAG: hypothetical protein ABI035_10590 [Gemmatimonadaceae bacterium]
MSDDLDGTVAGIGDMVRVRATPETQAAGLAGRSATVLGQTLPSRSGESVLGPCPGDYALHVDFTHQTEGVWLAPELLEPVEGAVKEFRRRALRRAAAEARARTEQEAKERLSRPAPRAASDIMGCLLDRLWPDEP